MWSRISIPLLLTALVAVGCTDRPDPVAPPAAPSLSVARGMVRCELRASDDEARSEIAALMAQVDALEDAGALNAGQARALRAHLTAALANLSRGLYCPLRADLGAFREQLVRFAGNGILEDAEARPLIDGANRLLNDLPPELVVDGAIPPPVPDLPGLDGGPRRPLARFVNADGQVVDFVANELYLETDDAGELGAFLGRWNGTVLATMDFSAIGVPDQAPVYLVRLDPSGADTRGLAERWSRSAGLQGENRVSSEAGLQLLAAGVEEAAERGLKVGVNFLLRSATFEDRATEEEATAAEGAGYTPNAFEWPYMNRGSAQDIGTAEAWRVLEAMGRFGNRVRIGVADGGFRPNADFPAGWRTVPDGAARIANPDPSNCGASAPFAECTWHGTHVVMTGMGRVDNRFGAAGPGGPVAEPVLLQSPNMDFFAFVQYIASSIPTALASGPRIVNISAGGPMPTEVCLAVLIGVPVCETLHGITFALRAAGILLVASAGNDGVNVDQTKVFGFWPFEFREEKDLWVPCELTGVLCVGGLAWNSNLKHPESNWGSVGDHNSVRMYSPFELWSVDAELADESNTSPDGRPVIVPGTSFSSPFVAGVAALAWAGKPDLTAVQVEQILLSTAHTNPPGYQVPRWINALGAVQRAVGGNTPPWVRVASPADGDSIPRGRVAVALHAESEDLEGDPVTVTWRSGRDGVLGTGASLNRFDLSYGLHVITATASDGVFSASDQVAVTITNDRPRVSIIQPEPADDGWVYACVGEAVEFQATGSDLNNWPTFELPESAFTWSSIHAPEVAGTGRTITRSLTVTGSVEVRATATDDQGLSNHDTVWLNVQECANTAPVPTITTPPADVVIAGFDGFDSGHGMWYNDVAVAGQAFDAEDGWLTGEALVWRTNRTDLQAAVLGTGGSLTVRLYSNVCQGDEHIIRLRATDSGGTSRAATRRITINSLC